MLGNTSQSQPQLKTYLPFHQSSFWDNFYKNHLLQKDPSNINWYFDLTTFSTSEFSLKNFSKDDEILLVGPGLSSTLDYFDSNDYEGITIFDFSETLTNYLKQKYNKEWEIATFNIMDKNPDIEGVFNAIIDKGCLDCFLSDPNKGEENFINALSNMLSWLDEENGVIYYFSDGKVEDRSQLFFKINKIKYKVETIDMNETMKDEYKEFNKSDNVYYLYTITREQ